jgi:predicted transposase/invertase (TIGR01784 family)
LNYIGGLSDKTQYHKTEIKKIFELIARDLISPKEYARMKDEYSLEQLQQDKFEQGIENGIEKGIEKGRVSEKQEIARNLLAKGIEPMVVAETTGLSSEELATLSSAQDTQN